MRRSILATRLALTLAAAAAATPAAAQQNDIPEAFRARQMPRQHLAGPRFGFTTFTGEVADLRRQAGKENVMSQFGWQFETQILSTTEGNQALMEWVVLVGGVEQDELNLSLAWLAGFRLPNGLELGVGPNASIRKDDADPTTSMVVAGGATMPFGGIYVPLNIAVAFAEGGPRITTLIGWVVG